MITEGWDKIIEAASTGPGLVALGILVIGTLAIPMTKGSSPNVRTGVFIFLVLAFLGAAYLAFTSVSAPDQPSATPTDTPTEQEPLSPDPAPDREVTYRPLSIDQEVATGNRLPIGTALYLYVINIGDNACDVNLRDTQGLTLKSHSFGQPGQIAHEAYLIRFTRTGAAGLKKTCHFDVQEQVPADAGPSQ